MTHCTTQTSPSDKLTGQAFQARRAQVQAIKDAIIAGGQPELREGSTAVCTHFKLRRGFVGGEQVECQLYRHAAGQVIRFWVYGENFEVRVRELVMLPDTEKGWDCWLDTTDDGASGSLFPHEGKYLTPALRVTMQSRAAK